MVSDDTGMVPLIVVNFKTYREATGENAVKLATLCESAAKKSKGKVKIAIAVQATDIFRVAAAVDKNTVEVFAQHIDANGQGKSTGFVTAEAVKESGASGTLMNHAEHKITDIAKRIATAKKVNMTVVVCAADFTEAKMIAGLNPLPSYVALEPPELIGGKVSVSKAKPDLLTAAVAAVKEKAPSVHVLCGAGVTSSEDVEKALQLGTSGILVASSVVLAKNPEKALLGLIAGIK